MGLSHYMDYVSLHYLVTYHCLTIFTSNMIYLLLIYYLSISLLVWISSWTSKSLILHVIVESYNFCYCFDSISPPIIFICLSICVFYPYIADLVHFGIVLISYLSVLLSFYIIWPYLWYWYQFTTISGVIFLQPIYKSSDLLVNPCFPLNPQNPWNPHWNPQIYADFQQRNPWILFAILRFSLNLQVDLRVGSSSFFICVTFCLFLCCGLESSFHAGSVLSVL